MGTRLLRCVYSSLAALGLIIVLVTFTPLVPWWGNLLAGEWTDPSGDVLIVLGGATVGETFVGENSYWRALYGVRAWRQGGFRRVLICGGGAPVPVSELMRDFITAYGVPSNAIQIETLSANTHENALNARKALGPEPQGRLVLLTSDYHMFRAMRLFRKAGLNVTPYPIPDVLKRSVRWRSRWPAFLDLVTETAAIGWYAAHGWI